MDSDFFGPKNFTSILLNLKDVISREDGKMLKQTEYCDMFERHSYDPVQLYSTVRASEELFSASQELRSAWNDLLEFCCA